MKFIPVRRFLFPAILFVFGFITLSTPQSTDAQRTKSGNEFDYYSDATHTVRVGFAIFCSNGQSFRSEQVTDFVVVQPSGC